MVNYYDRDRFDEQRTSSQTQALIIRSITTCACHPEPPEGGERSQAIQTPEQ